VFRGYSNSLPLGRVREGLCSLPLGRVREGHNEGGLKARLH